MTFSTSCATQRQMYTPAESSVRWKSRSEPAAGGRASGSAGEAQAGGRAAEPAAVGCGGGGVWRRA